MRLSLYPFSRSTSYIPEKIKECMEFKQLNIKLPLLRPEQLTLFFYKCIYSFLAGVFIFSL